MNISQYTQIIAAVIVFAIYIYGLFKTIKSTRGTLPNKWNIVIGFTLATLICIYLILNAYRIEPAGFAQIILTFGLVLATALYAISATKQADASMRMANEMRAQRRPIIISEVVPPTAAIPLEVTKEYVAEHIPVPDEFEISNKGIVPAIELEILLLDKGKSLLQAERKTFFAPSDEPIRSFPKSLEAQLNTTCYLLCRYRGVLSSDEKQVWYETWLPFEPVKSQRGDQIIIKAGELEFDERFEKTSY